MSILLIDDGGRLLESRESVLGEHGHLCVRATTVPEAMDRLQRDSTIKLVVLDLMMPQREGFALLEYLAANQRFSHIPVIICSGRRDGTAVARSLQLGARDYILTPIRSGTLLRKIDHALERVWQTGLSVDENAQQRGVLGRILEWEGYKTLHASTGPEAMRQLPDRTVDLVISAITMKPMSGWDVLLEAKERRPQLPVLLITDPGNPSDIDPLAGGADGVISLPFESKSIRRELKEVLAMTQRQCPNAGRSGSVAKCRELPRMATAAASHRVRSCGYDSLTSGCRASPRPHSQSV
ncbi:MAG: response regulator [Candidatus Zixiibacteriota bacterium]